MAVVDVTGRETADGWRFHVVVAEDESASKHTVTLSRATHAKLAPQATPEALVQAVFAYLLERESKESILGRFDLMEVSRYFPAFETEIRARVA